MTRWEPLQPSPVAVNALAAQEAATEYFRFHLGLFNCICVRCNETTAHPPISASRNAFKSWHFERKEKQLCFPELTVSTTTFNSTSCVQISLLCLETLCTMSDERSPEMYERKHQQQMATECEKLICFREWGWWLPNRDFRSLSEAGSASFRWGNSGKWITETLNYSIVQTGVIVSLLVVKKLSLPESLDSHT